MLRALVVTLLFAPAVFAATFNISNLNDSGAGSLRQAVLDANATAGADTITFQPGLSGTIVLTSGEIDITDGLTITGPGRAVLSVSGNDASRVFDVVAAPTAPVTVAISALTITNGLSVVPADTTASAGGAIRVSGESLSLDDGSIMSSRAGGLGGGIAFSGLTGFSTGTQTSATLTVTQSEIASNESIDVSATQQGAGGGIFVRNAQTVTIDDVTLRDNFGADGGGGLWATSMDATMSLAITRSRIENNRGGSGPVVNVLAGGGIGLSGVGNALIDETEIFENEDLGGGGGGLFSTASTFAVRRSTFADNHSAAAGGAIRILSGSTAEVENTTISGNIGLPGGGPGTGGGITITDSVVRIDHATVVENALENLYVGTGSDVTVMNSIFAYRGVPGDIVQEGGSLAMGYTLFNLRVPGGPFTDLGGNTSGDPLLAPLANNGGLTRTRLPAAGSPVIDTGDPAFTPPPSVDQRGLPRVMHGRTDMGAVEVAVDADLAITKTVTTDGRQGGNAVFSISVTNEGPDVAQNVVVTDVLPSQVTLLSATPSQGTCSGTSTVTCSLGTLSAGANATISIVVSLTGTGAVTNTASVTSDSGDLDGTDNSDSASFTIAAANVAGVPALDPWMLLLLAASLAIAATMLIARR